ncbi:hypothetical protein ACYIVA_001310 [Raoultella ornithinolytica]
MSFTRTVNIQRGECCPELGLAAAPADMIVDITYTIDSVDIVSDTLVSSRYKTFSNGVQTGLGRFEFSTSPDGDYFLQAEEALKIKVSETETASDNDELSGVEQ